MGRLKDPFAHPVIQPAETPKLGLDGRSTLPAARRQYRQGARCRPKPEKVATSQSAMPLSHGWESVPGTNR
jgi:hypothetical protein